MGKCEKEIFEEQPLQLWMSIEYGENGGGYSLALDDLNDERPQHDPDFGQKLDATLRPDVIDNVDDPMVRRLRALFGNLEDDDAPLEWRDFG